MFRCKVYAPLLWFQQRHSTNLAHIVTIPFLPRTGAERGMRQSITSSPHKSGTNHQSLSLTIPLKGVQPIVSLNISGVLGCFSPDLTTPCSLKPRHLVREALGPVSPIHCADQLSLDIQLAGPKAYDRRAVSGTDRGEGYIGFDFRYSHSNVTRAG